MKKVLALVLALTMLMMVSIASAATIQITHDGSYEGAEGTTPRVYNAYKVFDAVYTSLSGENTQEAKDTFTYTPDGAAVSYSLATDSAWKSVFIDNEGNQTDATKAWFDVKLAANGSKYIVTPKDDYNTAAKAKEFGDYLAARIPTGATSSEVTVDAAATSVDGPGYYLIVAKDDKDAVTKVAVVTSDAKLVEKNTYITTSKTTSQTSYNVGDVVTYTATVTIPSDTAITQNNDEGTGYKAGHGPIILHDKMDTQLSFISDAYNEETAPNGYSAKIDSTAFTGYTLSTTTSDDCTFEISIPVTEGLLGKTITFTYSAILNDTAADDTGYVNELFGELNGYKTTPDKVKVWTFDFSFKKDFIGATADASLEAKFELRTDAADSATAIKFNAKDTSNHKYEKSDDDTGTTELVIVDEETLNIVGLKAGTYWLVETSTSTGYNLLDAPVKVVITQTSSTDEAEIALDSYVPTHSVTTEGSNIDENGVIQVENNSGTVLPSTGGIGTTIFYVSGLLLVLGAATILIARRKADAE